MAKARKQAQKRTTRRKSQVYQFRLEPSDLEKLHARARALGKPLAEFIREKALA